MLPNAVEFRLSDGTSLLLQDADLRRIYEELWDISDHHGAISTAALLIDEARKYGPHQRPIELNAAQSEALQEAVAHLAKSPELALKTSVPNAGPRQRRARAELPSRAADRHPAER
jgi:hypothetical protein